MVTDELHALLESERPFTIATKDGRSYRITGSIAHLGPSRGKPIALCS